MKLVGFIISLCFIGSVYAADSTLIDQSYTHSRKKAAIMSLCLPGLGQFYNEGGYRKVQGRRHISWWRAPIIWGGLGVTAYFSYYNWNQSSRIKDEWLYRQNNSGSFLYSEYLAYTDDELISGNGEHLLWI